MRIKEPCREGHAPPSARCIREHINLDREKGVKERRITELQARAYDVQMPNSARSSTWTCLIAWAPTAARRT